MAADFCIPTERTTVDVRVCAICEDTTAVSQHYGGTCCSGCRGFFRRSVRFNRHYVCAKDGKCVTKKSMRTQCRSCRYESCIRSGLDPKLVHSDRACDRVQFRKQSLVNSQPELPTSSPENEINRRFVKFEPLDDLYANRAMNLGLTANRIVFQVDSLPLGFKQILNNFQRSDYRSVQQFFVLTSRLCDSFVDNRENHLLAGSNYNFNLNASVEEAFLIEPRSVSDRTPIDWTPRFFLTGDDFKKVWCRISVYYVDWLSHIPEINLLDDADKLNLIIGRCVQSVWCSIAYQTYLCEIKDCVPLTGGSFYPMDDEQSTYQDPMLSNFLSEMCNWIWTEIVELAKQWQFTEAEWSMLRVLCMMTPAKGKEIVREAHNYYQSVLSDLVLSKVGAESFINYSQRLSTLQMILVALERTSQIEDDHLTLMTLGNHGSFQGSLTYEFYCRRTGRI
ncbi:Nuclear receptor [Aphelenchoides besseyi]|nr:Nuclear receptor [Aphelenchoides besseyi]